MQLIEIRLGPGLLIVGTPGTIDPVMKRADDPFMRLQVLRKIHTDRYAMARVRTLYPMVATQAQDSQELAARLGKDLMTRRFDAAYLRESAGDVQPIELPNVRSQLIHLELAGKTVLMAARGLMPPQFKDKSKASGQGGKAGPGTAAGAMTRGKLAKLGAKSAGNAAAMAAIAGLDPEGPDMRMLFRQIDRLTFGLDSRTEGGELQRAIVERLSNGQIEAEVLTEPAHIAMAKARRETPVPIEVMQPGQRVAEAIMRSRRYLAHSVQATVEQLIKPENLPGMAALLRVAASAQGNPLSAALIDSTLVMIAWSSGGMAAVTALGALLTSIEEAAAADSDEAMEDIARQMAKAFELLGASALTMMMARSFSQKGGTQGKSDVDIGAKLKAAGQSSANARPARKSSAPSGRPSASGSPPKAKPIVESKPGTFDVQSPGQKGAWNKDLNKKLKPDAEYNYNGYTYKTDSKGNVQSVEGQLTLKTADRNTYQQAKTGKEGKDGDEGGHLIASIFNGPGEKINMAPMNGNLNKGEWKKLENAWADALKDGKKVEVQIEAIRSPSSSRPDKFVVKYKIDGGRTIAKNFDNVPGG